MVIDSEKLILEAVCAAIRDVGRLGDIPVVAGDSLKELGLSRLQLFATLIELEDKFDIEFPADTGCFGIVDDIAAYIQSHTMMLHDGDKHPEATKPGIEWRPSVGERLRQLCARAFARIFRRGISAAT
jgi:acyl carrier protein